MNERIVLITGASSGIGREIAKKLVQKGDFPLLVARNMDALNDLKVELKDCEIYQCDITKQNQVKRLVDEVIHKFGRVDVLVNNAGYGNFCGSLETPFDDYKGMIETNYLGAVHFTCEVLPHMLVQGGGRIINIASIAGLTGIPNLAAYCASKFALIGFSESIHLEYSPLVKVGVLCPGPVITPFFKGKNPFDHFPAPIARQALDVEKVAYYALQLIERPRMMVIPSSLKWAMKFRGIFPGIYFWATKKMYTSFKDKQLQDRQITNSQDVRYNR